MDTLLDADRLLLTADEFFELDQRAFGDAWRYELIDGRVVAMAPPTRRHAYILSNLDGVLRVALAAAKLPCRTGIGAGERPANAPQARVRVPDAVVVCGHAEPRRPVVLFEILSPSNRGGEYDEKIEDLKTVEGVEEIVEIEQDTVAARIRRRADEWRAVEVRGNAASLELHSLGLSLRLADVYADL